MQQAGSHCSGGTGHELALTASIVLIVFVQLICGASHHEHDARLAHNIWNRKLQSGDFSVTQTPAYNPQLVDWAGIVSACKAIGRYETRMASFIIRAGYHDAMAIDPKCLNQTPPPSPITICGGADGSAMLTEAEQKRFESQHRSYLKRTARAIVPIAAKYNASVADTLAVCGQVMPSIVGAANMLDLAVLRVGRIDRTVANPESMLLPGESNLTQFEQYWTERRMTVKDGLALLGVHALMENKGCMLAKQSSTASSGRHLLHTYPKVGLQVCNPFKDTSNDDSNTWQAKDNSCQDIRMFRLTNSYYVDICTPSISIFRYSLDVALKDLPEDIYKENIKDITCSFKSTKFREVALKEARDERSGDLAHWPDSGWLVHNTTGVIWATNACARLAGAAGLRKYPSIKKNCNHLTYWPYTRLDGHLGSACQKGKTGLDKQAGDIVKSYVANSKAWQQDYAAAYSRMMSAVAEWSPSSFYPTWRECPSHYVKVGTQDAAHCAACNIAPTFEVDEAKAVAALAARTGTGRPKDCPADCICSTAFGGNQEYATPDMHCGVVKPCP